MLDSKILPRGKSEIEDGKIVAPLNLELMVNDHCNIACRQCNHASPIMKKWNTDPERFEQTLKRISAVYRCATIRLLGGEPLLHPNLTELIAVTKSSGIGQAVQLTTNGMLLDRLPDEAWHLLDEIHISVYKMAKLTDAHFEAFQRKGDRFDTRVVSAHYPEFRMTFSSKATDDQALVNDIWQGCKMVNVWHCHAIRDTHFFRCPQSIYVPALGDGKFTDEGFDILNSSNLRDELLAFLNGAGPLKSCAQCVGSCGKKFVQEGLPRKLWKQDLDIPLEEMVDYDLLERSKYEIDVIDDCRKQIKQKRGLAASIKRKLKRLF